MKRVDLRIFYRLLVLLILVEVASNLAYLINWLNVVLELIKLAHAVDLEIKALHPLDTTFGLGIAAPGLAHPLKNDSMSAEVL